MYYLYRYIFPHGVNGKFSFYNFKEGDIFYIGKGQHNRKETHIQEAKRYNKSKNKSSFTNCMKLSVIDRILQHGSIPVVEEFYYTKDESHCLDVEANIIKSVGRINKQEGSLTNLDDGGTGISGYRHTDESKRKMSNSLRNRSPEIRKQAAEKMKGHPNWNLEVTNETKTKISKTMKTKLSNLSDEDRQQRVLTSCCAPETYTKERSENISKSLLGKKKSEEHCKNISKARKEKIKNMTLDQRKKFGYNRGKTWKLIDGKRVYFEKEDV